jgi:putative DNA primase/helicase
VSPINGAGRPRQRTARQVVARSQAGDSDAASIVRADATDATPEIPDTLSLTLQGQRAVDDGTTAIPNVQVNTDGIPATLRMESSWVAWTLASPKKPSDKPRKIPIDPKTGAAASSTDPSTWGSFEDATARMGSDRLAGIGFVFTTQAARSGIDLDSCRDPSTGEIQSWAQEIVDLLNSYTEISPSGTGVHIFVGGKLPPGRRRKDSIEMYDSGRFFTVTGARVEDTPDEVQARDQQLRDLHERVFGLPSGDPQQNGRAAYDQSNGGDLADDDLIERACNARNGAKFRALWQGGPAACKSQSEADLALCGMLLFWTGGDAGRVDRLFRRSGLMRAKWDERRGEKTYGQRTIEKTLAGKAEFYSPPGAASAPQSSGRFFKCTDTGNSERFVAAANGNLRYCHPWKKWLVWSNGRCWQVDHTGAAMRLSKRVVREIYKEAARAKDERLRQAIAEWAQKSEKAERRKAMVDLARAEEDIPILPKDLDKHTWLLNCRNGTLDLRSLQLHPHRREDCITKLLPVDYYADAACPRWLKFLERILPDPEVRDFLQRLVGYSLTGEQSEQVLVFCIGGGSNGKSTLLVTLIRLLGQDYAIQASSELLLRRRDRGHPTELADLFGVRLAVCMEVGEGRELDEVLVKQLTGGDRIRARRMREDFWEFDATHHAWLAANHKPVIHGTDHAIWRRIILIPFDVVIQGAEKDKDLPQKLSEEFPGILAWAVRGCQMWQEEGLNPPPQVLAAVQSYREEMDSLGEFLEERCVLRPGAQVRAGHLYRTYSTWSEERGEEPVTQKAFGSQLTARGVERCKSGGVKVYRGIALRSARPATESPVGDDWGRSGRFGV